MKRQLALFLTFITIAQIATHPGCGVDFLKPNSKLVEQNLDENQSEALRTQHTKDDKTWKSLRVGFDLSLVSSKAKGFNLLQNVLNKAKEVFGRLFKVKRLASYNFDKKCADIDVPTHYLTNYKTDDTVIFVRFDSTGDYEKNKLEAAAIHCQQEKNSKRPIAGHLTFRQSLFDGAESQRFDYLVWLAIHEVTHVLVFNEHLFNDWPINGNLGGVNKIFKQVTRPDGTVMKLLTTPKIIEQGIKHFNCTSFSGLPLDYKGGQGTSGSHWSKRYMNTDYMIGDSYGENLISPLTLALFEDSSWYNSNYTLGSNFVWGKNQGCDFLNPEIKCASPKNDIVATPFRNSFCSSPDQPTCSVGHVFRGNCKTKSENKVSIYEQYFKDPTLVGFDKLVDFCPIPIESKTEKSRFYGGSCRNGLSTNINSFEKVCPNCACFMGSLVYNDYRKAAEEKKSYSNDISTSILKKRKSQGKQGEEDIWTTLCLEYRCSKGTNGKSNVLNVVLLGKVIPCPEGQTIEVDGFSGKLTCPPVSVLCNVSYPCKFGCTSDEEIKKVVKNK